MAFGTTELTARSTLCPPTSTPLTSRTSSNSEASSTWTSRKMIDSSGGMWLSSRCSLFAGVFLFRAPAAVGYKVDVLACFFYEPLRLLVDLYALLPELGRALHPRD